MTKADGSMVSTSFTVRSRRAVWVAFAACGWAFLFAALSFFWAAGGRTGLQPLELEATSGNAFWIGANLIVGILKIAMGLLTLALVQSRGRIVPSKLLRFGVWVLGMGMFLYGGAGLVSDVLHVTGIISDPANGKWFFWYLVLWDPCWMLGGILYVIAAWLTRRPSDAF